MNCNNCEFKMTNKLNIPLRISKGMLQPKKSYCIKGKLKEIKLKDMSVYNYPIWCPLNLSKRTCLECGTLIRPEQGDYCDKCK